MMPAVKEFKTIGLLAGGRVTQVVVGLVALQLLTSFLTDVQLGRYYLLLAASSLVGMVFLHPVGVYINRRLVGWAKEGTALAIVLPFLAYLLLLAGVASLGFAAASAMGFFPVPLALEPALVVIGGAVLSSGLNSTLVGMLNILERRRAAVLLTLLTQSLGLVFSIVFARVVGLTAESWIAGLVAGQLLVALVALAVFRRAAPGPSSARSWASLNVADLPGFAWPLGIGVSFYWIQTQAYRFVLEAQHGLADVGVFVLGYTVGATFVVMFELLFNQYYQPYFLRELEGADAAGRTAAWERYARLFLPALAVVCVFSVAAAPFLTRVMVSPTLQMASAFVMWGALAESIRMVTSAYSWVGQSELRTRGLIGPSATGALVAVAGAWMLGAQGLHGVGLALVLASAASAIHASARMRLELPIRFPTAQMVAIAPLLLPLLALYGVVRGVLPLPTWWEAIGVVSLGMAIVVFALTWLFLRWSKSTEHRAVAPVSAVTGGEAP